MAISSNSTNGCDAAVIPEDRNCQWRVAARPKGNVVLEDFAWVEEPIPRPRDGEVLLQTLYLGLAPVMRMYMLGTGTAGEKPLEIGDVIHGRGTARVMESRHPDYQVGDMVQGQMGWQTYKVSAMTEQEKFFKCPGFSLPYALCAGVLGMTGLSAWAGFIDCGKPRSGETVVISGAAGGVGSLVVQMAKIRGCRVIGIAGGDEKCAFIRDLGCEASIDYKADNVAQKLAELCPQGIDLYFDNVGGEILSTCLEQLAMYGRVVLCGSISEYTRAEPFGLTNYTRLRRVNGSMQGFFVYNHLHQWDEAMTEIATMIHDQGLRPVQDMVDGFENMPEALARLYDGSNVGVQCCRVRGEPQGEALTTDIGGQP